MKQYYILAAACLFFFDVQAQITWSEDVAGIVYANCAACHREQGIAPFPLIDYSDAFNNANAILEAVGTGYMPPWTADTTYQDYAHERVLSAQEIETIVDWVGSGSIEGDPTLAPPPPIHNDAGFLTATPDLELIMPAHVSNATNFQDDYVCYSLPTGLTQNKKVRAFEVIPGNTEIVHHCLVYIDENGNSQTNTSGFCNGPTNGLIGGYTPGALPTIFPSDGEDFNIGVELPAGSSIVFALHYPAGSQGQSDETKIRFYFYDDSTPIREVNTDPIIQNWGFTIEANTIEEVTADFNFIPVDVSILSTFPHMHLIGESIESHVVTPSNDTIPLVRINHWDFEWQEFYFFQHMQHVPAGSTIYGRGTYNNMPGNPHNPNDPPQDISAGLNTSDEMFLIYYHYLQYQEGDELIDIEALTQVPTGLYDFDLELGNQDVSVYPIPAEEDVNFSFTLEKTSTVSLYIYDGQGRLVEQLMNRKLVSPGAEYVRWEPREEVSPGQYFYSILIDGKRGAGKIILK